MGDGGVGVGAARSTLWASLSSAKRQPARNARCGELEVDVLARRIAVDLDRDAGIGRGGEDESQLAVIPGRVPILRPRGCARM